MTVTNRFGAKLTAAGALVSWAPRICSQVQPVPVDQACQRALSVPWTRASSRGDRSAAAGRLASTPPTFSQPPSLLQCQSALSVPLTKVSTVPPASDTGTGLSASTPPRRCHPPAVPLASDQDHSLRSVPWTKASVSVRAKVAPGPAARTPPRSCQTTGRAPLHDHRCESVPLTKTTG